MTYSYGIDSDKDVLGGKKKEMIPRPLASFLLLPEQWFLRTQPEGVMSPADPFVWLWLVFSEDWTLQNSMCLCECGSCSSTRESPDFSNKMWAALTPSWGLVKSNRAFLSEVFFEKHLLLFLGVGKAPPSVQPERWALETPSMFLAHLVLWVSHSAMKSLLWGSAMCMSTGLYEFHLWSTQNLCCSSYIKRHRGLVVTFLKVGENGQLDLQIHCHKSHLLI